VDDALALLLALACPEIELQAVTVVAGNVGLDLAVRNALLTLEAAQLPSPPLVAAGAAKPLEREPISAAHVHGDDGLGGAAAEYGPPSLAAVDANAVEVILDTISYSPNEITLIALGPLTNLARAFMADPVAMTLVQRIVIMGGALRAPGNATPSAEYNFYADPEAARIVLSSGAPTTVVGLDATRKATVSQDELAERAGRSHRPWAAFAERICRSYFERRRDETGRAECILHDPLAIAAAVSPVLIRTERHALDVETDGRLTTGMLVADLREDRPREAAPGGADVAVDADSERFRHFFFDRVFG
jgi:purine nucleosidase/pyrimidine-specific ribonucleoside hydrolase